MTEQGSNVANWLYSAGATILAIWVVWVSTAISPLESRLSSAIKSSEDISVIRNTYINEKLTALQADFEKLRHNDELLSDRISKLEREK